MRLNAWQVVVFAALLLAAGAFKWQYSRRYKKERETLEAIERDNAETSARHRKELEQMKVTARSLRTGIPSCDSLADLQAEGPPPCKDKASQGAINALLAGSLDRMTQATSAADMGTICQQILDEVAAKRATCGN